MVKGAIHIGTSGWYYEHWLNNFYPTDCKANERISYYTNFFDTVEINCSFYHLPKVETIQRWETQASKKFIFSVKASRYITHMKKLREAKEAVQVFYDRIDHLKNHLGPTLFQLPPSFKKDTKRLEAFLQHLKSNHDHVFEFRHPTWFCDEIYHLLHKAKMGLCVTDLGGVLSPEVITSHFAYFRLHGPKEKYRGSYGTKKLEMWKKKFLMNASKKITTYCYFDNDEKGYAVKDALELKILLDNK